MGYGELRTLTRDRRPIVLVPMRLGYRECVQVFGWFGQSFGRWGNCKSCLHARLFSCRLSSCKIVFMQIVFMQDCFHARLLSCRISCNMQGDFCAFSRNWEQNPPRRLQNRPRRLRNRPRRLPKSTPDRPRRQSFPKFSACSQKSQKFSCIFIFRLPKSAILRSKREAFSVKFAPKGGPGAKNAIFFAKMRKWSKHRVARVRMALRTIQNRQKSVKY